VKDRYRVEQPSRQMKTAKKLWKFSSSFAKKPLTKTAKQLRVIPPKISNETLQNYNPIYRELMELDSLYDLEG
jgi:hypothetical protein